MIVLGTKDILSDSMNRQGVNMIKKNKRELPAWSFILQAANENEANVVESVLNTEGIPVLKQYGEFGQYLLIYTGMTNFGIDIFVPAELKEKALEILESADMGEIFGEEI